MVVRENIEFKRGRESKPALDIGMEVRVKEWLEENDLDRYEILEDLSIDLQQSLQMQGGDYLNKPDYVVFSNIRGHMNINKTEGLKELKGCPREVGGNFNALDCDLDSLIGAPDYVGGNFNVSRNKISSLDGFPKEIAGWVSMGDNEVEFTEEEIRKVSDIKGKVLTKVSHLFDSWIYK